LRVPAWHVVGPAGLVSGGCQDVGMAERVLLRRIGPPIVAGPPSGTRIRTRIHLTEVEAAALSAVGSFLGGVYRVELAGRIRAGHMDHPSQAGWRAERKRAVTAVSSSRWAGAITRAVEDQYQLGMRRLAVHVGDLRRAVDVLEARCALRPGESAPVGAGDVGGRGRRRRGYRSANERFGKTRRLAGLRSRLAADEEALAVGRPSITVGGKRLWRNRNHLDEAGLSEPQWRARWEGARMFLTADGESGRIGSNETIRVDEVGRLRIKVPVGLTAQFGSHLQIAAPVGFSHRGGEWAERVAGRRAVRYDISYDPAKDRWYLDASWKHDVIAEAHSIEELRAGPVLGVDLNADHLACCVLDHSGNPVGEPVSIPVETAGLPASRRDGRVRAAITALLDHAHNHRCTAVVIENLDFADARATGRETMGRGARGKRFRRTVAGIPTAKFRTRLTSMAHRRGIAVIGVDPAYTSKWGAQHWAKPLQLQTSDPVTRHHAAAAAIGRRGLGMAIRRRPAGPRNGQRTAAGTPPARPDHPPGHVGRHGSSGPPTRTRCVPVHRRTPATRGQHRTGRTRAELTTAHTSGTVPYPDGPTCADGAQRANS
jgi:IS605 OrfB family transposase